MIDTQFSTKTQYLVYIGHLCFLLFSIFAGIFYLERTLFSDPAYISFSLLNEGDFAIQVNRFGVAITQSIPLLGQKLGLSLRSILFLYSLCFPVLYWITYSVLVHLLKASKAGFALLFIFALMAYDSFYWMIAEYHQGMAMLVLFWAWMQKTYLTPQAPKWKLHWPLQALFAVFILFYHPLIIFPMLFVFGYIFLEISNKKQPWFWALLGFIVLVFVLKTILLVNPYDQGKITAFLKGLYLLFKDGNWGHLGKFLSYCLYDYYFFALGFIGLAAYYSYAKKWLSLILVNGFILGYVLLISFSFPTDALKVYMDGQYFALGFMLALPLLYELLPLLEQKKPSWAILGLSLLLTIRMTHIFLHHQPYTERLHWLQSLVKVMQEKEDSRFILDRAAVPMDIVLLDWGLCFETLLCSSLDDPKAARTAIIVPNDNLGDLNTALERASSLDWFHTNWGALPSNQGGFNTYFQLTPNPYRKLPNEEIPKKPYKITE